MGEEEKKRFEIPKPVSAGDEVDVTIEAEGGQGDGIAKVESFVVFVKGAKKGERCKIKITEVKRTYAVAEKIGEAAPEEKKEELVEEAEKEEAPPEEKKEELVEEAEKEEAPPPEEKAAEEAPAEETKEETEEKKEE